MHTSALAFQTLKYLGVLYLLYMAWMTIRDKGALQIVEDSTPRSAMNVIVAAILVNLLNPKLTIFFVALLPQFVDTNRPHATLKMLEMSGVMALMTFVIFCIYGVIAASARQQIIERPQVMTWFRRIFAGTFGLLAVRLATTQR
jgi:threonine/homoserine/homoserine lactone efflux protein